MGAPTPSPGPDPTQARRGRAVIGVLMAAILAVSLLLLQSAFDRGDREKAFGIVAASRPDPSGRTVAELLAARNGGAPPPCEAAIRSGCRGLVLVRCAVGGDPEPYAFAVDLVKRRAWPANPSTSTRLAAAPPGGGAPGSAP